MSIIINKAVLHILYNDGNKSYFSDNELDFESEVCYEFICRHINKLVKNKNSKEALFLPESQVYSIIKKYISDDINFIDMSKSIVESLHNIMNKYVIIPSSALLIVDFCMNDEKHILILKLNYKECFTHSINQKDDGVVNEIVKYKAVLPFDGGRVDESCIIPYEPMIIKLIEKKYMIDGKSVKYFSENFLGCVTELSVKEVFGVLDDVTSDINKKYQDNKIQKLISTKNAIIEDVTENNGTLCLESMLDKAFGQDMDIKQEYLYKAKEKGVSDDITLNKSDVLKHFGIEKFKSNNGVELKLPSNLITENGSVQLVYNQNGTVDVMLKNLIKKE